MTDSGSNGVNGVEPANILIVDDHHETIVALCAILESPAHRLVVASSGPQALLRLLQEDFAVALLDVMMPGMDGWEVATLVKDRPRTQHLPIIFLTGIETNVNDIFKAYASGAVDYLQKPVQAEVVRAKVAVFVDLFRKQERLKRQAELLRESERAQRELAIANLQLVSDTRYRNLAEAIPHVVWTANPDGSVRYFNQRWFELTGLSAELSLGWSWPAALHPDDLDLFMDRWRKAVQMKEPFNTQCRIRNSVASSYRWHLCRALPERAPDGEIVGWLGTFSDIDDLQRAGEERARLLVRERQARAEAESAQGRSEFLAEASKLLGNTLQRAGTLDSVARLAVPQLATFCVAALGEPGKQPEHVALAHADPAKEPLAWKFVDAYQSVDSHQIPLLGPLSAGGSVFLQDVNNEVLEGATLGPAHLEQVKELGVKSAMVVPMIARGRQLGTITFASADGERRYEAADLAVAEDLARRAALALENATLYQEAQEAIRARDEFLLVASHELRTPLTALQLQVAGALRSVLKGGPDLPGSIVRRLGVTTRQVERLATLIDELLDVSRITTGRLQLELEEMSLSSVTREVVGRFEEEISRAGSQVAVHTEGPATGRWDRVRVEQVITNLLSNAVKYGAGKPIEIRVSASGNVVSLTVRDHGIGIDPENHGLIFERFGRAVPGRSYGGLGLGLYIVQQIIKAHGGSIRVDSAVGLPTTFTVELPVIPPVVGMPGQGKEDDAIPAGSEPGRAALDS
jgi:PAS domain S-box-containing protein